MKKATFYRAGCPVWVSAEQQFVGTIDSSKYDVEVVHLGEAKGRIEEAEGSGVKSVPAMVVDGQPCHINWEPVSRISKGRPLLRLWSAAKECG